MTAVCVGRRGGNGVGHGRVEGRRVGLGVVVVDGYEDGLGRYHGRVGLQESPDLVHHGLEGEVSGQVDGDSAMVAVEATVVVAAEPEGRRSGCPGRAAARC